MRFLNNCFGFGLWFRVLNQKFLFPALTKFAGIFLLRLCWACTFPGFPILFTHSLPFTYGGSIGHTWAGSLFQLQCYKYRHFKLWQNDRWTFPFLGGLFAAQAGGQVSRFLDCILAKAASIFVCRLQFKLIHLMKLIRSLQPCSLWRHTSLWKLIWLSFATGFSCNSISNFNPFGPTSLFSLRSIPHPAVTNLLFPSFILLRKRQIIVFTEMWKHSSLNHQTNVFT